MSDKQYTPCAMCGATDPSQRGVTCIGCRHFPKNEGKVDSPVIIGHGKPDLEALTIADYEDVLKDHRRLVRELDIIINGKDAAPQASLCDIVSQLEDEWPKRQGAVWVKASVRLPATGLIVWRWQDKTEAYTGYKEKTGFHFGTGGARVDPIYYSEIEWLDEQATTSNKEQEMAFAEWCNKNYQQYFGGWKSWKNPTCFYNIEQLHDLWQQTKRKV